MVKVLPKVQKSKRKNTKQSKKNKPNISSAKKKIKKEPQKKKISPKKKTVKKEKNNGVKRVLKAIKTTFKKKKPELKKVIKKPQPKKVKIALKKKKIKSLKTKKSDERKIETVKLKRSIRNPILEPRGYSWESKATFNPTAFVSSGKVHLIYRAVGEDDVSVLGYASSFDGHKIEERPTYHIYKREATLPNFNDTAFYASGGGWCGGCEDPRVTLIGDTIYLMYVAFDGWSSVRLALTSIKLADFKKQRWDRWEKPVLISPPGEINKNWVLFPEKINGKFAILHSFYPKILIDYFDDLNYFDGTRFLKSNNTRPVDKNREWDSWFRGVGPTPMRIKEGWLVLYHAMDHKNPDRYRMGALILDAKDPKNVLFRSKKPILEPEEHYENHGHKWGVVYSCGAVIKDGRLFVYYGGADKFVCVASIKVSELVEDLKKNKTIKLKKEKILEKKSNVHK